MSAFPDVKLKLWQSTRLLWSLTCCSTCLVQVFPYPESRRITSTLAHFIHTLQSHLSKRYLTSSMQRAQGRAAYRWDALAYTRPSLSSRSDQETLTGSQSRSHHSHSLMVSNMLLGNTEHRGKSISVSLLFVHWCQIFDFWCWMQTGGVAVTCGWSFPLLDSYKAFKTQNSRLDYFLECARFFQSLHETMSVTQSSALWLWQLNQFLYDILNFDSYTKSNHGPWPLGSGFPAKISHFFVFSASFISYHHQYLLVSASNCSVHIRSWQIGVIWRWRAATDNKGRGRSKVGEEQFKELKSFFSWTLPTTA